MSRALLCATMILGLGLSTAAHAGKKPKAPPPVGWVKGGEEWKGECYFPPDFEAMGVGDRRIAWQTARDAIMQQWNGTRNDGVMMDEKHVTNFETVLLAKPERMEQVARENLEQCKAYMTGGSLDTWLGWLIATPGKLTVGECPYAPLDYTLFDYLDIHNEWQIKANVCKGDHIKVKGTEGDYFQLEKGGPWINVAGDPAQKAGGKLPCNIETCYKGQLLMRFTADNGVTEIKPVGTYMEYFVPDHGRIEVMINDDTLTDNVWKVETGLEHHTGIEYAPVEQSK